MKKEEMSSSDYKKGHEELWQWLADNPTKEKHHWPGWKHVNDKYKEYIPYYCFACGYAKMKRHAVGYEAKKCDYCPCDWGTKGCCNKDSPFYEWDHISSDSTRRVALALKIKNSWVAEI